MNLSIQIQAQTVHILMPVFNTEQYLHLSLESVLTQSYEDINIIVYNDGSTDGSCEILESYQGKFNKKLILLQSSINRGISHARKCLLDHSQKIDSNAMILWLDSDDCFTDREFVEKFVRQMQKTKAQICLFNFDIVLEDENQIGNINGLLNEREVSALILDSIQQFPTQMISPGDLPNIMGFTSLGWTKGYYQITFPQSAACPYEDFAYMAALLNASKITAFASEYKPIQYLRRANSITGKRSAATFEAVLTQLQMFVDQVDADKKIIYHDMIKAFVRRKIEQYENLLIQLISAKQHVDLSEETLEVYQKRAGQLLDALN